MDTKRLQKEVYDNKVRHGFNVTDLNMEFCLAHGELSEAYIAWLKKQDDVKQKNKFIYGLLLSAINVFPIPFYVFLSATLVSYNVNVFGQPNSSVFALGVVVGSIIIFGLYLKFFNSKSEEDSFILKNINYVIGGVTSVISLLTIYQLFQ